MNKPRNRIGLISLSAAALGFLFVTLQPWIPLDRVLLYGGLTLKRLLADFFDASLVGSLADWFAVTALFRNPLGIKLPHTDILAKNKGAIAEAVPRFLASFLGDDKISEELARIDYAGRLTALLSGPAAREGLLAVLRERLPRLFSVEGSREEQEAAAPSAFVERLFRLAAEKLDLGALAAGAITWVHREGLHETVIARGAELLMTAIEGNRDRLIGVLLPVIRRNAGWQGLFVNRGVVERLLSGIEDELFNIRIDSQNDIRRLLSSSFGSFVEEVASAEDGKARMRLDRKLRELLASRSLQARVSRLLSNVLRSLRVDLDRPESLTLQGITHGIEAMTERLADDEWLRRSLNREIAEFLAGVFRKSRLVESASSYVASLLKATDEKVFVTRVEEAVWNDLQYIRVNGAVVGGLAGVVIALFSALI